MNIENLASQFLGQGATTRQSDQAPSSNSSPLQQIGSMIPGGLMGGAAAGGIMALLLGSKKSRKMAGKVAKYGGTALLGGLAYKAYGNWQNNKSVAQVEPITPNDLAQMEPLQSQSPDAAIAAPSDSEPFEMVLIKAMICAAKSDGEFDAQEQTALFAAIEKLQMNNESKGRVFDLMQAVIPLEALTSGAWSESQKSEIYLSAYLAINVDTDSERAFLTRLASGLQLPNGLAGYLEKQADLGFSEA